MLLDLLDSPNDLGLDKGRLQDFRDSDLKFGSGERRSGLTCNVILSKCSFKETH